MKIKNRALLGVIPAACLASGAPALAQSDTAAEATVDGVKKADEIVVIGTIGYRNRTDSTVPTLQYDEQYFQRFEPLTAGDALKRVPSVTFLSDVIESDGVRLRGLDPGYTQVLINGERVPGAGLDRSFFLDRIPAELIDRVEIVRSSSARRTGDAVAGTVNIVLRDAFALDGGYVRGGALRFDDGRIKETAGAVWGGQAGPGRLLVGLNVQGRYNPKEKLSLRFSDSPENNPNFLIDDFDNREDQSDIRNGRDYSFNLSYLVRTADDTELEFSGIYVRTDRTEDERSFEYEDPIAVSLPRPGGDLLTDNEQLQIIDQQNYSLNAKFERDMFHGRVKAKVGFASFEEERDDTEQEIDFDRSTPRFTGDFTLTNFEDQEFSVEATHDFELSPSITFAYGVFWQDKDRKTNVFSQRNRFNVTSGLNGYNQFERRPGEFGIPFTALLPVVGGLSTLEERRLDSFLLLEGAHDRLAWEIGIRQESTDVLIVDLTEAPADRETIVDYGFFLPSASLKFDLSNVDRITLSGARTVRRPNFDFITPVLLEAELGENDLLGNPTLRPETAWGFDVGYERRIGRTGIAGVNFFYRDVTDLVEVATVLDAAGDPVEGSEGSGTVVLTPQNTGSGSVWGVEFDMSMSLGFFGLEDTGVFGNFSWLESDVNDIFGSRRFNDQSKFVYNFGVIQNVPRYGVAFGATYRKQGEAFGRVVGEEVTTTYGADLEVFLEKRIGKAFTARLVGSNLLNGSKDEIFNKFTTIDDQTDRSFDEFELESEQAGPFAQLVIRYAF